MSIFIGEMAITGKTLSCSSITFLVRLLTYDIHEVI